MRMNELAVEHSGETTLRDFLLPLISVISVMSYFHHFYVIKLI